MSTESAASSPAVATAIAGYSHVNLLVDDLDAARRFYGDVLGFAELPRPGVSGTGGWFRVGDLQLHLSVVAAMPSAVDGGTPHIALHLPRDGFDEFVATIAARGANVTREPQSREQFGVDVRTAFCRDPAGNLVELTDVGPLD